MSGLALPTWLLRGFRETAFGVLLAWLSTYTYDHLVKPLAAPPVHSGEVEEARLDIGKRIAPSRTPPPPPAPPPISPELPIGPVSLSNGTRADIYGHQCRMPDGRSYTFRVVVFSAAYSWVYEQDDQVELNGHALPAEDFVHLLESSRGLQDILGKAHELIAVGTASCEGSEWSQEDGRALNRAKALGAWMERARPWPDGVTRPVLSVHLLNLGRYWHDRAHGQACDSARSGDTADQRKVVLMAVLERDAGADLQWCIEKSLSGDDQLRPLLDHYRRFDLNATPAGGPL